MEFPVGVGGSQMTLWKGNSKGVGGKNQRTIRGGYGYFLKPHNISPKSPDKFLQNFLTLTLFKE